MKQMIISSLKQLTANRRLMFSLIGLVLLSVAVVVYVAVTIESSDLRIITHYTAYGVTHFYRSAWTYLFSFILFVVFSAFITVGICLKLLSQDREELAFMLSWVGMAIVSMALIVYVNIDKLV